MNATAQWPSLKILLVESISLLPTRSKEKDDDAMMRSLWWQEDSSMRKNQPEFVSLL
jgi:hypothetical protein